MQLCTRKSVLPAPDNPPGSEGSKGTRLSGVIPACFFTPRNVSISVARGKLFSDKASK